MEENKELTMIVDINLLKPANEETGYLIEFEQNMKGDEE